MTYTCYCMLMLEHRLQILIDDARYRRIAAAAQERRTSIATVVRDAIDQALPSDSETKRAAADAILSAEPIDLPATVEELKRELDEIRGGATRVIFVDTNVLLYAIGGDHPARDPARHLVTAIGDGRLNATTTTDVIQEFAHVYSRRRPRADAVRHALGYAALFTPLAVPRSSELQRGLALFEQYDELGAADAVLAATALADRAEAFVSADRAFAVVEDLPFVELGSAEFDRVIA